MSLSHLLSDETIVLSKKSGIVNRLNLLSTSATPILVAISGESAAGKTTFLQALASVFKQSAFIDADNYFSDISEPIAQMGGFAALVNSGYEADAPENFQLDKLCRDLSALKNSTAIRMPYYEMTTGKSYQEGQIISPAPVVFVAGICTFYEPVRDLFDFKIYLQPDKIEQRVRYFKRAVERGQNGYDVFEQFNRVCAMAEKYIVPTKPCADLVLKGRLPKAVLKRHFIDLNKSLKRS